MLAAIPFHTLGFVAIGVLIVGFAFWWLFMRSPRTSALMDVSERRSDERNAAQIRKQMRNEEKALDARRRSLERRGRNIDNELKSINKDK